MITLPITLDQVAELIFNELRREEDNTVDLSPVVKLTIPESNFSALLVSVESDFKSVYGLFTLPCGKSELTAMKVNDLINISEILNKAIIRDKEWQANGTINDYYQKEKDI